MVEQIADPADDPETVMANAQQSSILRDCLQRLSPAHREIIDLVYYHQRSVSEVAEILDIPRNTVKTRMFYARNQIAKHLKRVGIECARV